MPYVAIMLALLGAIEPTLVPVALPPIHRPCPDSDASQIELIRKHLERAGLIGMHDAIDARGSIAAHVCPPHARDAKHEPPTSIASDTE